MKAQPLMILGTSSHVGKSILTVALGRILSDDGFRVAPFKAQNMSLNSAATPEGREIGRAQALQAEACRSVPCAEMNPVLIKPSSHTSSQVVVLGRVWGQVDACDYYRRRVEELFPIVLQSYRKLSSSNEVILLEGAGSPAEINLKARDIVNLRMAMAVDAPCLLVGDIDRGGVFASLLGTLELLDQAERACIRGFIINKFRGDITLLTPGIKTIEQKIGIPCVGVVPFLESLGLEEEDSVSMETRLTAKHWTAETDRLRVAVIALPHISNFSDFDALASEPAVSLAYVERPKDLAFADVVIIPGSKQTIDDLDWLRNTGLASLIRNRAGILLGICGGMQMLGRTVEDPDGTESGRSMSVNGLDLLPISTTLRSDKVTRMATGALSNSLLKSVPQGTIVRGYEIHLGETEYLAGAQPLAMLKRSGSSEVIADGAISREGNAMGTYLHGLFDDDDFRHAFLQAARLHCGLGRTSELVRVSATREERINRLATHVRRALDMNLIYSLLAPSRLSVDAF